MIFITLHTLYSNTELNNLQWKRLLRLALTTVGRLLTQIQLVSCKALSSPAHPACTVPQATSIPGVRFYALFYFHEAPVSPTLQPECPLRASSPALRMLTIPYISSCPRKGKTKQKAHAKPQNKLISFTDQS